MTHILSPMHGLCFRGRKIVFIRRVVGMILNDRVHPIGMLWAFVSVKQSFPPLEKSLELGKLLIHDNAIIEKELIICLLGDWEADNVKNIPQ